MAPIFPQARYADGYAALRTGDYASAVSRFNELPLSTIRSSAGDAAVREHVVRAASMIRDGRLEAAIQQLQGVVADTPDHAEAHRLLGLAYWLDDQQGKSIEHLRSAIRLAPDEERARVTLADVLAGDRRLAEAERELTQAIDGGMRSGRIHYELAQLYERQSLLPQAAKSFHDSEAFGPIVGRDQFYRALGSLLVNQADFDGAVTAYTRRIEANPNSGEAHRQLGEIYFLQGRDEEALAEIHGCDLARSARCQGARRGRPGPGPAAQVRRRAVALERALSLDPNLREARYALGTSLMRLGKTEEASGSSRRSSDSKPKPRRSVNRRSSSMRCAERDRGVCWRDPSIRRSRRIRMR